MPSAVPSASAGARRWNNVVALANTMLPPMAERNEPRHYHGGFPRRGDQDKCGRHSERSHEKGLETDAVSRCDHESRGHPGTPERAGEALAELALGTVPVPTGRTYASLVKGELTFPDPSKLARNDEARDTLWGESAAMVGIDLCEQEDRVN